MAPLVAVNSTVSPAAAPGSDMAGVVSEVTLSVSEDPVSDAAARSGADGADGADVSMLRGVEGPADEMLPAWSVSVPDTDHVPSVRVGRSHEVPVPITYVHEFVVDPLDAVMVAVSPVDPPDTENAGVVSEVMSSVGDDPESEAAARFGSPGADGAVLSIVMVVPVAAEPGPVTPDDDVTEPLAKVGMSVPSPQPDAVTVMVAVDPEVGEVEKLQPAVPALEISPAARVEASMLDVNVRV